MRCAIIERVTLKKGIRYVHVVSHGPQCLDGVTAAVVVARYHADAEVRVSFSSNAAIDETLLRVRCEPRDASHSLWITDISWTDPAVDRHLTALRQRGVDIYWIDHHRTALQRWQSGAVLTSFTAQVLDESYAASRLTFDYLVRTRHDPEIAAGLERLVAMADDNDRWLHRIPDSRQLALAVSALDGEEAYADLLTVGPDVVLPPRLRAASERVDAEIQRSLAIAAASRTEQRIDALDVLVVSAVCDGYPSEIADRWGKAARRTVYALYDVRGLGVSLRRSPDCLVDLSAVAAILGGGGHPAAAGCELALVRTTLAQAVGTAVAEAVARAVDHGS